jgi:hypothetical protein
LITSLSRAVVEVENLVAAVVVRVVSAREQGYL